MSKKCYKCGRPMGTRDLLCDECVTLADHVETVVVILELTLDELGTTTCALADAAAKLQYDDAGNVKVNTLKKVAEAFRNAPEDEKSREAEDAHVQWRHAQE